MKTLVLGLGNELYGDDGAGIHVIKELRSKIETEKKLSADFHDVDLLECSLTGFALLDVIIGYDRLIIVDTIKRSEPKTGRITILEEKDLRYIPGPSPHYVSIPQTIEIGRQIHLKVPAEIKIIAIEAKNIYNLGEGLTKEMEKTLPAIINKTIELVKQNNNND
ncbi:MAG: hydrogenase maturation protease [Candidatus Aminicenantes bacterium]|nr:hydrogenase maturation protease [Candidatus Aminicenantes bacterium]